jgi:acyl carrier protein
VSEEALWRKVSDFMSSKLAVGRERIAPDSTLFGDFGVDGDDGVELVEQFSREFDVDVATLDLTVHFGLEASANLVGMVPFLIRWIMNPHATPEERAGLTPIRVSDMVDAAWVGRWVLSERTNIARAPSGDELK